MTDTIPEDAPIFPAEAQQAIFDFTFILAKRYVSPTCAFPEALEKACLWVESMLNDIRSKMKDFIDEQSMKETKLFTQQ